MCSKITCHVCGKATWSGCGQHVEEALAGVPQSERCAGHADDEAPAETCLIRRFISRLRGKRP